MFEQPTKYARNFSVFLSTLATHKWQWIFIWFPRIDSKIKKPLNSKGPLGYFHHLLHTKQMLINFFHGHSSHAFFVLLLFNGFSNVCLCVCFYVLYWFFLYLRQFWLFFFLQILIISIKFFVTFLIFPEFRPLPSSFIDIFDFHSNFDHLHQIFVTFFQNCYNFQWFQCGFDWF